MAGHGEHKAPDYYNITIRRDGGHPEGRLEVVTALNWEEAVATLKGYVHSVQVRSVCIRDPRTPEPTHSPRFAPFGTPLMCWSRLGGYHHNSEGKDPFAPPPTKPKLVVQRPNHMRQHGYVAVSPLDRRLHPESRYFGTPNRSAAASHAEVMSARDLTRWAVWGTSSVPELLWIFEAGRGTRLNLDEYDIEVVD